MHILRIIAGCLLWVTAAASADSQPPSRIFDRSPFFDAATRTSDDVRRVPEAQKENPSPSRIVVVGGRIFDGTDKEPRLGTVVIAGNRIEAVIPGGAEASVEGATFIDAGGKTVMPGLIDLHTHLSYVEQFGLPAALSEENVADATLRSASRMRLFALAGITSVRDVGSHGFVPFVLKRWQREGRIEGPRIFAAGQIIVGRGGHGTEGFALATAPRYPDAAVMEVSGADAWRDAVRLQFQRGADWIKLASHYSPAEIEAAVEEAHALGLPVTVDAETQYIDMAITAGVDCIEHPLPRSAEALERMSRLGIAAVPTLVPYQYIIRNAGGYFGSTSRRFTLTEASIAAMLKNMKRAGIRIGVGTDLVVDWVKYLPGAYIAELRNLVDAGFSPRQALVAATATNADILKMGDRLGRLQPGMLADLIVVNGKPDVDPEALADLEWVIVDGRIVVHEQEIAPAKDARFASP